MGDSPYLVELLYLYVVDSLIVQIKKEKRVKSRFSFIS